MTQKVNTPTSVTSVTLTPLARVVRTVIQVVLAVGAAIPTILNTPLVSGNAGLTKDVLILGGWITAITALQNVLEHAGILPVIGGKPGPLAVPSL